MGEQVESFKFTKILWIPIGWGADPPIFSKILYGYSSAHAWKAVQFKFFKTL